MNEKRGTTQQSNFASENSKLISQQKVSVFCEQILSLQQAKVRLKSRKQKKDISDNYNVISIDRTSSKIKNGTDLRCFNNSL